MGFLRKLIRVNDDPMNGREGSCLIFRIMYFRRYASCRYKLVPPTEQASRGYVVFHRYLFVGRVHCSETRIVVNFVLGTITIVMEVYDVQFNDLGTVSVYTYGFRSAFNGNLNISFNEGMRRGRVTISK